MDAKQFMADRPVPDPARMREITAVVEEILDDPPETIDFVEGAFLDLYRAYLEVVAVIVKVAPNVDALLAAADAVEVTV